VPGIPEGEGGVPGRQQLTVTRRQAGKLLQGRTDQG
jgi:hypothetical protein